MKEKGEFEYIVLEFLKIKFRGSKDCLKKKVRVLIIYGKWLNKEYMEVERKKGRERFRMKKVKC